MATVGIKITSFCTMKTVYLCLRHEWTVAYSGPVSVQQTQAIDALLKFSGSVTKLITVRMHIVH